MQQVDQARQSLANIGYQINAIGAIAGKIEPQQVKQALQSLSNAVSALANAVAELDQRTKK